MNSILETMYLEVVEDYSGGIKELSKSKECKKMNESYEELDKTLNKEQRILLENYYSLEGEYCILENIFFFKKGAKLMFNLMLELLEFDLSLK